MGNGQDQLAQPQLVPVEAWFCGPINTGTADASDGCFCRDGTAYIIKKSKTDNPHSPHNEWFCANLALKAGVPIAPFNVMKHTEGEEWFGSQYRIGEVPDWWLRVLDGTINIDDVRADLCRIYALDLFVFNIDRHNKNFLVVPSAGTHQALAMDHGRSWLFSGFPPPMPPFAPGINTKQAFEWMKSKFAGFPEKQVMRDVLGKISAIPANYIGEILARQPTKWLSSAEQNAIKTWWDSGGASQRASLLIDGIDDDTLL